MLLHSFSLEAQSIFESVDFSWRCFKAFHVALAITSLRTGCSSVPVEVQLLLLLSGPLFAILQ